MSGPGGEATRPVLATRDGRVGRITLNRPEAMNAVTTELARALRDALDELGRETSIVLIRGAGGNFSVGGDFHHLEGIRHDEDRLRALFGAFREACDLIAELPAAVVAVVEGYALAGGFELMLASDFALVAEDAVVGDNHSNFGQIPGGGSSQRLPRLVGRQQALGILLTGDRLSGAEAAARGLAYRAVPRAELEREAEALAERFAGKSPASIAQIKRLVREGLERPLADGLDAELDAVVRHVGGPEGAEAFRRFATRGG